MTKKSDQVKAFAAIVKGQWVPWESSDVYVVLDGVSITINFDNVDEDRFMQHFIDEVYKYGTKVGSREVIASFKRVMDL